MQHIQKIAIPLLCILMLSAVNIANAMKPGQHNKPSIMQLAEQLNLSDAQKAQLETLEAQHQLDRDALKEKYNISDRESFREEKRALHQAFKKQIKQILTAEQMQELKALHHQRRRSKLQD